MVNLPWAEVFDLLNMLLAPIEYSCLALEFCRRCSGSWPSSLEDSTPKSFFRSFFRRFKSVTPGGELTAALLMLERNYA